MYLADLLARPVREASHTKREKTRKVEGHFRSIVRADKMLYNVMIEEFKAQARRVGRYQ